MITVKLFPEVKKIKSTVKFHLEVLSQVSYYVPVSTKAFCSTASCTCVGSPIMCDIKSDTYISNRCTVNFVSQDGKREDGKFQTEW